MKYNAGTETSLVLISPRGEDWKQIGSRTSPSQELQPWQLLAICQFNHLKSLILSVFCRNSEKQGIPMLLRHNPLLIPTLGRSSWSPFSPVTSQSLTQNSLCIPQDHFCLDLLNWGSRTPSLCLPLDSLGIPCFFPSSLLSLDNMLMC